MNNKTMTSAKAILRDRNKRGARNALLLCLAILVVAGVAGIFHLPATAKTYQVTQLTCTAVPPEGEAYADFFVHIHNDDCFDANGNLVCPLPEIRPHRHTADCFVTTRTLICAIPESDGHQHTEDCYTRVRGDLICERSTEPVLDNEGNVLEEGHVHTDECFAWTEELTCGLEAGQGAHHHDDSCFETSTTLTCEQPEILLHTHTEDCYQKNEDGNIYVDEDGNTWLICGQIQVLEHVHGPECFTTYELDDGEAGSTENTEGSESGLVFLFPEENEKEEQPAESANPETETGDTKVTDGSNADPADGNTPDDKEANEAGEGKKTDGEETDDAETEDTAAENTDLTTGALPAEMTAEETVGVSMPAQDFHGATDEVEVFVTAPEGAFPAGTTMHVTTVPQEEVIDALNDAANGVMVRNVQAVDITFRNAADEEIEPLLPISVRMSRIAKEQPIATEAAPETKESVVLHVENDGSAQIVENANVTDTEAEFESDSFSTYVMADLITEDYLASDGANYRISVKYDASAKIPEGAELAVSEITGGVSAYGQGYEDYLADTENALGENERVSFARFFDISIIKDGIEIQPETPVEVKIELVDNLTKNVKAVHFDESVDVLDTSLSQDGTVVFSADSFSVYGVVLTEIIRTDFMTSYGALYDVAVHYNSDAEIPEGSTLRVTEIEKGTEAYENSYRLLFHSEPDEATPMLAVDISILSPDGIEIEPRSTVTVDLTLKQLPEGVPPEELQGTIKIDHLKEVPGGIAIETVATAADIMVDETIEASFEVDHFSQFNITWTSGYSTRATVRVHYVDEDGNDLNGQQTRNISYTNNNKTYTFADYATQAIDDASYIEARLGQVSGDKVTSVSFARSVLFGYTYTTTFYNESTQVSSSTYNQTYDVYLVYENTAPGLTVSKTSTGGTTPANATFTVSSTDGEYTRTFTYADMTNGKIKFEDAPVGKTYTVTENGGERNGYVLTTTYGNNVSLTESKPSGTLTVNNTYTNDPNVVKVYVYVAAYDQDGNQFKNNPEFLELLGISGDTVDGNGYFPVGEIYIDKSFFNGKTTNKWAALINSATDWEHVLAALGELDTSTLIYDTYDRKDYALNQGNSVGDYMDQAIGDINKGAGSQCTALFGWSGHSYGFEDQTVEYHLDLRFQTNKVTFITGNNGISSGASKDGTTVDVRAYIQGSPIQQPRNLVIPAGYRLVGYYNDPDFTTPWNKIGTPITQDEVAYIKITPQNNVILYYKPVPAGGGTVSLDAEGLNPETGTPTGSTATANPGYKFVGWYGDEECTQLLSTDASYVPTKNSNERWVDGTTYYAKFEEETVTLTFVAEDHVDHVELVTDAGEVVSVTGNNTKEMKVTVNQILGPSVTVRGVAEDGYVIKEWTINGRDGALTTNDNIVTAINDDPVATDHWTERTYHVYAETEKLAKVYKQVNVIGTVDEQDVDLYVYFALKKKGESDFLMKDGRVWTEKIEIKNGVPQVEYVTFNGLQSGTYDVWEVADENASNLRPGSIVIEQDSGSRAIIVANIHTYHGESTSNNITVNDIQTCDELTVVNTYSHENEAMDFTAKKQWFSEPNTVNQSDKADVTPPEGAWAEFAIFVKDTGTPLRTIRLDGTVDDDGEKPAWTAVFDGMPRVDENGQEIHYEVRETSFSEILNNQYYYAYQPSTNVNGGAIKNAILFGNINVYKQIEVQPRTEEMDALVTAAIQKLKIHVTGPFGYDKTFSFTDVTDPYNPSMTISGLPAGEYTLEELEYEELLTGRKWNPTLSWIKAGNATEQSGQASITFEVATNGASNDTVDVRIKNDYTKYDITAKKVWDDSGLEKADHPSVSFTLVQIDENGNRKNIGTKIIGANQTGDGLIVKWEQQEQQEQRYTYEIVEAPVDGYTCVSIEGDMFQGFTVTNKLAAKLRIVKVDQTGSPLAGAKFRLKGPEGSGIDLTGLTSTLDEEKKEALIYENASMPFGTYVLTETDSPAGFNSLEGPVQLVVKLTDSGQVLVEATINGQTSSFAKVITDVNHPELGWTVTIMNSAGVELPSTGGPGTALFTVIGGIVTALAGAILTLKRRKAYA